MTFSLISRLREEYLKLKLNDNFRSYYIFFNYLNLSVLYGKDERDFDNENFKLIKYIYKNIDKYETFKSLNPDFYFSNFKEYKYVKGLIIIQLIKDFLRIIKQFIDIFLIIIVISVKRLTEILGISKKTKRKFFSKNIYSIYYPKYIKSESVDYYYPNSTGYENLFFITCFDKNKFISIDILFSLFRSDFISPAKILGIRKLLLTLLQFIHLYFHEIYLVIRYKQYSILKLWYAWTKSAEIFYSLLVYNSLILISKSSYNCEFISWYENQITNRSFSLGVSYSERVKNSFSNKLSTFNGTPFATQYKRQYLPTKIEFNIGFWGKTYYVQDKDSFDEMNLHLIKNNINISLMIAPKKMLRFKKINLNSKKAYKKNKILTIFTHDKLWDFIACLFAVLNSNDSKKFGIFESIKKQNIIFVRLHPSLNKDDVNREIFKLKILPKEIKLIFIDNKIESIEESILSSRYSVFGISSYLNLAIKLDSFVLAVDTNHIHKPPIQKENLNSENLKIISPW